MSLRDFEFSLLAALIVIILTVPSTRSANYPTVRRTGSIQFIASAVSARRHGRCSSDEYQCLQGSDCFFKSHEADYNLNCVDGSDESHRNYGKSPRCDPGFFRCNCGHCIPRDLLCNDDIDCFEGEDEADCEVEAPQPEINPLMKYKEKYLKSSGALRSRRTKSTTLVWGTEPHRMALSLYLLNHSIPEDTWTELRYETSISLLSSLFKYSIENIESEDLALYLNAFLVLCMDPRDFHAIDLNAELRRRARADNYTSPFVTLARCNARDAISVEDVEKLVEVIKIPRANSWTDTQALAIMALACAVKQGVFSQEELDDLTLEIKKKQFINGTVENIKTTALVLQALLAAQNQNDEDNFDREKALHQVLRSQLPNGSFGSSIDNYYILPVLSNMSLVNISDSHCKTPASKDPKEGLHKLYSLVGPKKSVRYSIWIGSEIVMKRDVTLKVPVNSSLYVVMELAADIDPAFRCKYNVKDQKPYVYQIGELQDDPEREIFWFLYSKTGNSTTATMMSQSPAVVTPLDNEHFAFWYRRGPWHSRLTKTLTE